jgi:transposase-like protein
MREKNRKTFNCQTKTKVALEAVRGTKTINEIAQEYNVHSTQIGLWKKELLASASEVFDTKRDPKPVDESSSQNRLYTEIGRLRMELDWPKKSRESVLSRPEAVGRSPQSLPLTRQCELALFFLDRKRPSTDDSLPGIILLGRMHEVPCQLSARN